MADTAMLDPRLRALPSEREVVALSQGLGESPDLQKFRLGALSAAAGMPLPDRVQHVWRYTDPEALLPRRSIKPRADRVADVQVSRADGPTVTLSGGREGIDGTSVAAAGFRIQPLSRAAGDGGRLGLAVPASHGLFEAINGSAWSDGLWVHLGRRQTASAPLRIVVPLRGATHLPRLLITVAEGARATVIEEHVGGEVDARAVAVTELFLAPGAELQHVLLQRWQPAVHGHLTSRAVLERDSSLKTVLASFGGAVVKLDVGATLSAAGARSELVGVALGEGRQHLDHHTVHRHLCGRTWSNLNFKTAMTGRARSIYTGLIRIEADAPQSEAYQENRNLLLSRRSRADTIPELEILTDDVSCSHGATVAPVDAEQLFYLRSRGVGELAALRLIVRGFLEDTVRGIPEQLRPEIERLIASRLERLTGSRP